MNSVYEPGSRIMSKNRLKNNTESNRIENRPSAPSVEPVGSACPARLQRPCRAFPALLSPVRPARPTACAPSRPPRTRLLPSPCCIATQLPVLRHRQPCLLPQFSRFYCDTTLPPAAPFSHNTKHCIAIQFHAVQSLAIQILQYNPSLHKPQSQYKILYCNTNSPQISLSLQYKNCIAIQFFFPALSLAIQIHNTIGQ